MNKKIILTVLCMLLLTSCGGNKKSADSIANEKDTSSLAAENTSETTDDPDLSSDSGSGEKETESSTQENNSEAEKVTTASPNTDASDPDKDNGNSSGSVVTDDTTEEKGIEPAESDVTTIETFTDPDGNTYTLGPTELPYI